MVKTCLYDTGGRKGGIEGVRIFLQRQCNSQVDMKFECDPTLAPFITRKKGGDVENSNFLNCIHLYR